MTKSIVAILAGFVLVVVMSIVTDITLERSGLMKLPFDTNPTWFVWLVIGYRTVFGVIGSYLTASLAPNRPMRHAMIGGFIGLALSIIGAIVMRDQGPAYYAIMLIALALPSAWVGGMIRVKSEPSNLQPPNKINT